MDGTVRKRLGVTRTGERHGRFAEVPARRPAVGMALGALSVSVSPVVIDLSGTSPGTASFYRCLPALPVLAVLARRERRRTAARVRGRWLPALAGVLFAGDMLLWTQAIADVGAGLSTVLVNVQVVLVPLLAWIIDRERVTAAFALALPILIAGVVLTAGLADGASTGRAPGTGAALAVLAALCYAGFLFLLRRGDGRLPIGAYRDVTAAAALASLVGGAFWQGVDLAPGWAAFGWLLVASLTSQIVGWLLVALCSPRLPSHVGASILLLTPAGAVAMAAIFLNERPSPLQLLGCVLILIGAYVVSARRRS
ncbi:DMT family transporter [Actinoallomurus sp. CA-142502]|uniref:DMT family transporter n=1 Tax=Actinoallomurus sp. CA-142502 TaxID=3239885 RepID=UPI003D8C898B